MKIPNRTTTADSAAEDLITEKDFSEFLRKKGFSDKDIVSKADVEAAYKKRLLEKQGITEEDIASNPDIRKAIDDNIRAGGFGDGISYADFETVFDDFLRSKGIAFTDDDSNLIVRVFVMGRLLVHRESFTPEEIRKMLAEINSAQAEAVNV